MRLIRHVCIPCHWLCFLNPMYKVLKVYGDYVIKEEIGGTHKKVEELSTQIKEQIILSV